MSEPLDQGPCRGCGQPVTFVWKESVRPGGVARKQFRTCTNPNCRLKQPGQRRQGDRV